MLARLASDRDAHCSWQRDRTRNRVVSERSRTDRSGKLPGGNSQRNPDSAPGSGLGSGPESALFVCQSGAELLASAGHCSLSSVCQAAAAAGPTGTLPHDITFRNVKGYFQTEPQLINLAKQNIISVLNTFTFKQRKF